MNENHFKTLIEYASLGYEITLTTLYGKDAVRMVKIYSYKAERSICCEQIFEHERLNDFTNFIHLIEFMSENIKEQEESGKYYESINC